MSTPTTVDITLLGREYRVNCALEERDSLLAAVAHVEAKMKEIAARTRGSGERLAVMTALNLAHELLSRPAASTTPASAAGAGFDSPEIERTINSMTTRMDSMMAQQESLL